jgi:peroxidase
MREHNRVARELKRFNPNWNDETIFQECKRIVNAQWQHIVYNEWLPIVLGEQFMTRFGLFPLTEGFSTNYRTDFDPRITNAFASAAFRMGHTLIPGMIKLVISSLCNNYYPRAKL